jgi:hypothetical protein
MLKRLDYILDSRNLPANHNSFDAYQQYKPPEFANRVTYYDSRLLRMRRITRDGRRKIAA